MPSRTTSLGVLFADICDSTGLYEALGDDGGRRLVLECQEIMKGVVARCDGTTIECVGDELMCTFPDAARAGWAACELHREVEGANAALAAAVAIRIGFQYGPVATDREQIYGDTIHVARRLASLAKPKQTVTSRQTKERIPPADQLPSRFLERTHLKGKPEAFELFEIVWDEEAATARDTSRHPPSARPQHELRIEAEGRSLQVDELHPTLSLGRDARTDIAFDHKKVSRFHARIEYRRDRFVFIDQSTNGSVVIEQGGSRQFVLRDEWMLTDAGTIVLGPGDPDADFPQVRFEVRRENDR